MLADAARTRLTEGSSDDAARVELAEVLARHLACEPADIVGELLGYGTERVLQLACDLASVKPVDSAVFPTAVARIAASLPAPLNEALREATASVPTTRANPSTLPIWRSLNTGSSRSLRLARTRACRQR